jgi:hypothetical protein
MFINLFLVLELFLGSDSGSETVSDFCSETISGSGSGSDSETVSAFCS